MPKRMGPGASRANRRNSETPEQKRYSKKPQRNQAKKPSAAVICAAMALFDLSGGRR